MNNKNTNNKINWKGFLMWPLLGIGAIAFLFVVQLITGNTYITIENICIALASVTIAGIYDTFVIKPNRQFELEQKQKIWESLSEEDQKLLKEQLLAEALRRMNNKDFIEKYKDKE